MATLPALFDITGRVALVTGAASGLGLAIAEMLAEAGAQVVMLDQDRDAVQAAANRLGAMAETLDIAAEDAVAGAVRRASERFGRLDIAFANAGISAGPGPYTEAGQIENVDPERWRRVLDINLTGVFRTVQAAAAPMKAQGRGSIVVTASTAGYRADRMVGYAYAATKAAVVNLVRQAAVDLARFGVRVNGLAPGPFRTNIGGGRMRDQATEDLFAASLPLGRIGSPQEIKGPALLLASDASSFMAGATLAVDGGALAW